VANQQDPRQLEGIEQGQHIACQALIVVAARWCLRPPESSEIGADDAVVLGEARKDMSPGIPVLWPAMEENERRTRLSGSSNVHAQPGGLNDLMIDSRNSRQIAKHAASLRRFQCAVGFGGVWVPRVPGTWQPNRGKGLRMSGKIDEAKGRAKEAAGSLTGNKSLKGEGKVDKASGSVKDKVDGAADKAKDAVNPKGT
jgi:uncharacterized protein YjbJ (UPF0337 family)